jgi:hypothetical protein
MSGIDERLERQINRALDGALSDEERLALDRELIRHPEARRLMERCAELDRLAGDALHAVLAEERGPERRMRMPPPVATRPRYSRAWWFLPAAAAATILLSVLIYRPPAVETPIAVNEETPPAVDATSATWADEHRTHGWERPTIDGGILPAVYRPTRIDRAISRDVYGVRGDDGNIYLIEVQRVRSLERPGSRARLRPVGGDL